MSSTLATHTRSSSMLLRTLKVTQRRCDDDVRMIKWNGLDGSAVQTSAQSFRWNAFAHIRLTFFRISFYYFQSCSATLCWRIHEFQLHHKCPTVAYGKIMLYRIFFIYVFNQRICRKHFDDMCCGGYAIWHIECIAHCPVATNLRNIESRSTKHIINEWSEQRGGC